MANPLLTALRADDKSAHLFESNGTFVAYKTGFPELDYDMGFMVNVFDDNNKLMKTYPAKGIVAGSVVCIIGKTHVGKTTLASQIAANIVRPFPSGCVFHYDLEGGSNPTRVSNITRLYPSEMEDKYILRQAGGSIEELKATIANIYLEKIGNPSVYMYDTGELDSYGKPLTAFAPTVLVIDSVASMTTIVNENTKDGIKKLEEISSQTEVMRLTAEIGRFFKESMPMLKRANIIMIIINHIKTRPGMGVPQAPELRYLKQDETLPCGKAIQYYTNTLIRLTAIGAEKYEMETDGFDGFGVNAQFIKNRSNIDGTVAHLMYDKVHGYDSLKSSFLFAKDMGLIGGNRAGYYFGDRKDKKFKLSTIRDDFNNDRELYKIMYEHILPIMEKSLSVVKPEEFVTVDEEFDY